MIKQMIANFIVFLCCLFMPIVVIAQESENSNCNNEFIAETLNLIGDRLPKNLDEFSKYSTAQQRVIFGKLRPKTKSLIWKKHLKNNINNNLSKEQKTIIQHAIRLASSKLFSIEKSDIMYDVLVESPLKSLESTAAKYFDEESLLKILFSLPSNNNKVKHVPVCNCYRLSIIAGCGFFQSCDIFRCEVVPSACGGFWLFPCDGMCAN